MKYNFIYVTVKDKEEAKKIGHMLVESHLAACVNIIDNMVSIYRWENKIEYDREAVLIAKTREDLTEKLVEVIKKLHSYSCPCIIALPILKGNKDYLEWIKKETV